MDYGLKGRVALVTGGARGIGFGVARMLAGEGASVAIADINGAAAEDAARRLAADTGVRTLGLACDITSFEQVRGAVASIAAGLGTIDTLVNTAALVDDKTFIESTPDDWRKMIDVCLYGTLNTVHAVLPGMVEKKFGRIVCMASDSARTGQARLSYYAAAKGGVIALIKSVAQEVGRHNVTLNVISPGATNTELRKAREAKVREQIGEERFEKRTQTILKMYPLGRLGEPEDAAGAVTFLVSSQASWITGQVLSVNGGFAMF